MGILLCFAAFLIVFLAGRRSLVTGLTALLSVGYAYGILRANFPDAASHFIFDAGVLALYATQLFRHQDAAIARNSRPVLIWLAVLVAWPVLFVFLPLQDPLVQLVGLRGNIFLLPFLLLGARLQREEIAALAMRVAILNLLVFAVTAVEYRVGIEPFFPHNANTDLIYHSADVVNGEYRIPSTFTGSHAYAGTMVTSMPFLLAAWAMADVTRRRRVLLVVAMAASILGTFAAASRSHLIVLAVVMIAAFFSARVSAGARAVLIVVMALIAIIVLAQERLQRFTSLQDTTYVTERVGGSVNNSFWELPLQYPLGNGLGGGGTSLPYFLQDRVKDPVVMENEYARILLEQSPLGLCLWVAFIAWFASRRFSPDRVNWQLGEHMAWIACLLYFGTALIGIGLLTSIPQTMFFLLAAGWASARRPLEWERPELEPELVEAHA